MAMKGEASPYDLHQIVGRTIEEVDVETCAGDAHVITFKFACGTTLRMESGNPAKCYGMDLWLTPRIPPEVPRD